jgi:hypothetical protein
MLEYSSSTSTAKTSRSEQHETGGFALPFLSHCEETMSKQLYEKTVAMCRDEIPGFEVRFKSESFTSKLIGILIYVFNREYMTRFTTTRYPRVYFPSREWLAKNYWAATKVLCHEFVHLYDRKRRGSLSFNLRYLSPQFLALGALGALGAFLWLPMLLCLCFLGFALPWPAPGRVHIERRGYKMSMAINFWRHGSIKEDQLEWVQKHFVGWNYYKMCWSADSIHKMLYNDRIAIIDGSIFMSPTSKPYDMVCDLLECEKVIGRSGGAAAGACTVTAGSIAESRTDAATVTGATTLDGDGAP